MSKYACLLGNYRNAWKGLHMIRETVEALGSPGVLPSQEAVIALYGPEPIHEAQAIVDALTQILREPAGMTGLGHPDLHRGSGNPVFTARD
jgi:hypothetical protein